MLFRLVFIMLAVLLTATAPAYSFEFHNIQLESQVEALFMGDREMAEIKRSIDRMGEPSVDIAAADALGWRNPSGQL